MHYYLYGIGSKQETPCKVCSVDIVMTVTVGEAFPNAFTNGGDVVDLIHSVLCVLVGGLRT